MKTFQIHPSLDWRFCFGIGFSKMDSLGRKFTHLTCWIGPFAVTFQWIVESETEELNKIVPLRKQV